MTFTAGNTPHLELCVSCVRVFVCRLCYACVFVVCSRLSEDGLCSALRIVAMLTDKARCAARR